MTLFPRIIISSLVLVFSSVSADIERVSVSSSGAQVYGFSESSSISADGRFAAFASLASTLVDGDTNNYRDIFVHDRETGLSERVSVSSTSLQANEDSFYPSISADGRFMAFSSRANNLVDGDTNNTRDIFVHDRDTGLTERVSVSSSGVQGNANSDVPSISADGRFVAFWSNAGTLVNGDTNGYSDIFVHDRDTGLTERVSVSSSGVQGNAISGSFSISADGRFVAFSSRANNLVDGDTNNRWDTFVHDRDTGFTERVSVSSSGVQGNASSIGALSISADGRFAAFSSLASTLVDGDTNNYVDIFVHDRETGLTERISIFSAAPSLARFPFTLDPSISADGRFVAFQSWSSTLVDGDTNGHLDIFVHDRDTEITERVSLSSTSLQANEDSFYPSISADGHFVTFESRANNLVDGDTNNYRDIFVANNPLIDGVNEQVTIKKSINSESSLVGGADPLVTVLAGRPYRADYTVTNTSSTRLYSVKVFDNDQGSNQLACNLYALAPGQTKKCHHIYQAQSGTNVVVARVEAKVSGENTLINATTPQIAYVGQDAMTGGLTVNHGLNNQPGDNESNAVMIAANADQSWQFQVTNTSNIDVYKVKVYNDGVFPQNTGWEELCLIGKLKIGETRYCKRTMVAGGAGLNLMMGRAQANDAFVVGSHQYINAANPTYYIIEP